MSFGLISVEEAASTIALHAVLRSDLETWLTGRPPREATYIRSAGFAADEGSFLALPDSRDGHVSAVVIGLGAPVVSTTERDLWAMAGLPDTLPAGTYRLADEPDDAAATAIALGWALGTYAFEQYKPRSRQPAQLVWPDRADRARVTREAEAVTLARDLVNRPAGDLGPVALGDAGADLARRHGAKFNLIVGDALLEANYPMIYHVGRAATEAPRLIDFTWGDEDKPRVTLVGKGVCFDTGGLDLKPAASMKLMKKDMGGSANILALSHLVMAADLPVRLRVLIPAVENAISANALRPLDVLPSRKGISVEVGNTDAEGRLVLADALTEADSEFPRSAHQHGDPYRKRSGCTRTRIARPLHTA